MLDTQFLRPMVDAGNPDLWPFPAIVEPVNGAFARPVISGAHVVIEPFIEAGRRLVERDACAVRTTFGLLVRYQRALKMGCAHYGSVHP